MRLYPAKLSAIEASLDSGRSAKYYFDHHVTRHWHLTRGLQEYRVENLNKCNYLPRYCYIALQDSDEFNGMNQMNKQILKRSV